MDGMDTTMTDLRKCDGPGCNETAVLNADSWAFGELTAQSFSVVEQPGDRPSLHFHSDQCMFNWLKGRTKVNAD